MPIRQKMPLYEYGEGGSDYGLFFVESLKSFRRTASLIPSSRFLAHELLRSVDFARVRTIVELGPGTGAITREILKRLPADGRLYALDVNPNFVRHLRACHRDERLMPILGSADDLRSVLGAHGVVAVDAVISSLGLSSMEPGLRVSIVQQAAASLDRNGVMTQYQYLRPRTNFVNLPALHFHNIAEKSLLQRFFGSVESRKVLLNIPPAVVFTCRK